MLDWADFAFLTHTAEDETAEGRLRAMLLASHGRRFWHLMILCYQNTLLV